MIDFIPAKTENLPTLLELYNSCITTTTATFDLDAIGMEEFEKRIYLNHKKYNTFVVQKDHVFIGFCFITRYRSKPAYDETAEIGIYLKQEFTGQGYGKEVVLFLEESARKNEVRVLIASVSSENTPSINLFNSMDYDQCAYYKQIATKFDRKLDIIDMQKIL